jgi:hypothetical protein
VWQTHHASEILEINGAWAALTAVAEERRSEWRLFRLWNFSREPKAFELLPPLDAHVSLTATAFQASFY